MLAISASVAMYLGHAPDAQAQPPAGSDTTYTPPPPPPSSSRVTSRMQRTGEERDRVELGAAVPRGDFDFLGTFGYRRFVREGGPFEQSVFLEVGGTGKDHLIEGSLSLYYFFRPLRSYKQEWKLRPIVEIGPGAHVVVQSAEIEGFDDSAFHSQGYLKTHLYFGFELLLSEKFGILARGRASVPEHKPLDYAQAAIFLR
ncbi:MAG TPA: hypothetical protein VFP58_09205 [Candidatus Eisenbacteria bacterium]|nr:hypothetical protein [Candidatus Eisenbacteria bacterium]